MKRPANFASIRPDEHCVGYLFFELRRNLEARSIKGEELF